MKQDLKFFTDRVGFKVHRISPKYGSEALTITGVNHANDLFASQESGCRFFKSAKLRIIMQHIQLFFDGRRIKAVDQMEVLRRIETHELVLENPEEMPETYRNKYFEILDKRNA